MVLIRFNDAYRYLLTIRATM